MIAPVVGVGRVTLDFLDNEPDPKSVLGGLAIASNEERSRGQATIYGMLARDGEWCDKLRWWKPVNVARANPDPDTREPSEPGKQR